MKTITVSFDCEGYEPIEAEYGSWLNLVLDQPGSPVKFGCRSGLCGICAVEVTQSSSPLEPPDAGEQETLDLVWPDRSHLRLACVMQARGHITIKPAR